MKTPNKGKDEGTSISLENLLEERGVSKKILRAINETALSLEFEHGNLELRLRVPAIVLLLCILATSEIGGIGLKTVLMYLSHFPLK
jgi:hypothetical protein